MQHPEETRLLKPIQPVTRKYCAGLVSTLALSLTRRNAYRFLFTLSVSCIGCTRMTTYHAVYPSDVFKFNLPHCYSLCVAVGYFASSCRFCCQYTVHVFALCVFQPPVHAKLSQTPRTIHRKVARHRAGNADLWATQRTAIDENFC